MRILLAILFALTCALPAQAQNVRLSQLTDVDFPDWSPGDGNQTTNYDSCAYKDAGPDSYQVTATGSGGGGAFELDDGGGNTLAYALIVEGNTLTSGVAEPLTGANQSDQDCAIGGLSMNVQVDVSSVDLGAATPGNYSGTVSILMEP